MNADGIIKKLNNEFPGKVVIPNSKTEPTEVICEVEPSNEHAEYSLAVAYIKKSSPHRHVKATETYVVEEEKLDLYLDGVKKTLNVGQSFDIVPGVIHWAEGNWARVRVTSKPGWKLDDNIIVEKAVSAGGVIVKDGKVLFVNFSDSNGITFPKGHVGQGESYEEAALREAKEETGLRGLKIVRKLGMVTRPSLERDGKVVIKDIYLFLMQTYNVEKGEADEDTEWLSIEEALPRLFPQEAEFLRNQKL
jgi:ADP-ribose pyrophosphatase YjhB (NUDIX family)/quercetin dioxygenase-like cupin family protein